jgi:hypothetical protein
MLTIYSTGIIRSASRPNRCPDCPPRSRPPQPHCAPLRKAKPGRLSTDVGNDRAVVRLRKSTSPCCAQLKFKLSKTTIGQSLSALPSVTASSGVRPPSAQSLPVMRAPSGRKTLAAGERSAPFVVALIGQRRDPTVQKLAVSRLSPMRQSALCASASTPSSCTFVRTRAMSASVATRGVCQPGPNEATSRDETATEADVRANKKGGRSPPPSRRCRGPKSWWRCSGWKSVLNANGWDRGSRWRP